MSQLLLTRLSLSYSGIGLEGSSTASTNKLAERKSNGASSLDKKSEYLSKHEEKAVQAEEI